MRIIRPMQNVGSLALLAVALAGAAGIAAAESDGPPPTEATAVDPVLARLGPQLMLAAKEYAAGNPSWAAEAGLPAAYVDKDKVWLQILAKPGAVPLKNVVAWYGGTVHGDLAADALEAWMPVKALQQLAVESGVEFIALAALAVEESVSEGRATSMAGWWNDAGGITGRGVLIGVVDAFDPRLLVRQQAAGEVPSMLSFGARPTPLSDFSSHGNAVLEILHDIAPDATYVLYHVDSEADAISAYEAIAAAGMDIVTSSVSFEGEFLANGIADAFAAGVFVVDAAGNYARSHWAGGFRSPADQPNELRWNINDMGGDIIAIEPSIPPPAGTPAYINELLTVTASGARSDCVPDGQEISFAMTRDSVNFEESDTAWGVRLMRQGSSGWHIDSYATASRPFSVSLTTTAQSERLLTYRPVAGGMLAADFRPIGSSPGCSAGSARYGLSVVRRMHDLGPVPSEHAYFLNIRVALGSLQLNYSVPQASLSRQAGLSDVFAVGAALCNGTSPTAPASACADLRVADYSSQGPAIGPEFKRPVMLSPENLMASVGHPVSSKIKPDAVAYSGVTTSLSGGPGSMSPMRPYQSFGGTSAAAPHVAGMAALLLQHYPAEMRGRPEDIRFALNYLSSLPETNGQSLLSRGYTRNPSYVHGRGLTRFQREAAIEFRGRIAHTCVAQRFATVPMGASPDRLTPFPDGHDASFRLRFTDTAANPVLYPALHPMVYMFAGPNGWQGVLPMPLLGGQSHAPYPLSFSSSGLDLRDGSGHSGWFAFNELNVPGLPPAAASTGIGSSYNVAAKARPFITTALAPDPLPIVNPGAGRPYFREYHAPTNFNVRRAGADECAATRLE